MTLFLNNLTNEELERFGKFIYSPFFNTRPKIVSLFNYLKENIENGSLTKKDIFPVVYPDIPYNDVKMRRLLSHFAELYEKFLGYLGAEKWDEDLYKMRALEVMKEKGMNGEYKEAYRQASKYMKGKFIKDDTYYKNFAGIESLNFHTGSAESLQNALDYTDLQFVFSKLHSFRDAFIYQTLNVHKYPFRLQLYDEVIGYVKANLKTIKKYHPNLYIIYLAVMSMHYKNDQTYIYELTSYIKKHGNKFDKSRLNYYYTYVTTYYWMRINEGDTKFRKNVLDIYKYLDSKELLRVERYISHDVINSVVIAAISNFEYGWLEDFIEKYKDDIEPEYASDVYHLSLAKLYFNKEDYPKALQHLNNVDYKDPKYYVNAKIILSKTLYEQGDLEGIKYVIDNLKHYAYRNRKLLPQQAENVKTFITYLSRLIQIKKRGKANTDRLKKSLDKEKLFVPQKSWFYEKLAELNELANVNSKV
jgi:hypothetical protein